MVTRIPHPRQTFQVMSTWMNVKTYGAVGDGVTDDTTAIQNALNNLSVTSGGISTSYDKRLYFPAGTYKISSTLTLTNKLYVGIFGHHPSDTKILWAGAAGTEMFHLDGVSYSDFGRITLDGAGNALCAYAHRRNTGYATTFMEHADEVFQNMQYGIRAGYNNGMDAECTVARCRFLNTTSAAVSIESFNAVDWQFWHNEFIGGVNAIQTPHYDDNGLNVGGNFYCWENYFENISGAIFSNYNLSYFIFTRNYALNCGKFYQNTQGQFSGGVTIKENIILDSTVDTVIDTVAGGPYNIVDNIFRSRAGANLTAPVINMAGVGYNARVSGNTYTVRNPVSISGKIITYGESIVPASAINPTPPIYWDTPSISNFPVIELSGFSPDGLNVNTALNAAIAQLPNYIGQNAILHIPPGSWNVTAAITWPDQDFQIWGDGCNTLLAGPSTNLGTYLHTMYGDKLTIKDIWFRGGTGNTPNVKIYVTDDATKNIYVQGLVASNNAGTDITTPGITVKGFTKSIVEFHHLQVSYCNNGWGVLADNSDVRVFGGATSDTLKMWDVINGGKIIVEGVWYESASLTTFMIPTGPGEIHLEALKIANTSSSASNTISVGNFQGKIAIVGCNFNKSLAVTGSEPLTNVLFMCMDSGGFTDSSTAGKARSYNNVSAPQSASMDVQFIKDMTDGFKQRRPVYMQKPISLFMHRVMVTLTNNCLTLVAR